MSKILMRGGADPANPKGPEDLLRLDFIGTNSGNTLYLNSMCSVLAADETKIILDNYDGELGLYSDKDIEFINSEYDAYVIPLADAFRDSFEFQLKNLTSLIKRLSIPCIVTGVGLRASYNPDLTNAFSFDESVCDFVDAVLEKSSSLGLRGGLTGKYLERLGYVENRDFDIIGCPSMYTYGPDLYTKRTFLTNDTVLNINFSQNTPQSTRHFLYRIMRRFHNGRYTAQETNEYKYLFLRDRSALNAQTIYPWGKLKERLYLMQDRFKFYSDAKQWLHDAKDIDISVGSRFHGNVAALLNGAPSLFVVLDARMQELVSFHHLPHMLPNEFDAAIGKYGDEREALAATLEMAGLVYDSHLPGHAGNHSNFMSFLNKNGLRTNQK